MEEAGETLEEVDASNVERMATNLTSVPKEEVEEEEEEEEAGASSVEKMGTSLMNVLREGVEEEEVEEEDQDVSNVARMDTSPMSAVSNSKSTIMQSEIMPECVSNPAVLLSNRAVLLSNLAVLLSNLAVLLNKSCSVVKQSWSIVKQSCSIVKEIMQYCFSNHAVLLKQSYRNISPSLSIFSLFSLMSITQHLSNVNKVQMMLNKK